MRFGPAGQITTSSIQFQGRDLSFDIENGVAAVGSDGVLGCGASLGSGACATVGAFVPAPEPGSAGLVLSGVVALAGIMRRRG